MDPTEVARHTVPQVQLERSLGSPFHLAVSFSPLFQGVSDGWSASLPLALSSDRRFSRGQGAPRRARDSPLGVGAPRPPPPPRSCRSAPLRAGIWAQRGIGWRELAAANSGVARLGGKERTRVQVTGTGLRATSSGSPGSATFAASSWGPGRGSQRVGGMSVRGCSPEPENLQAENFGASPLLYRWGILAPESEPTGW